MSDSRSGSADAETNEVPVFSPPSDYKRVKHLKKFHKKKHGEQLWLIQLPRSLDVSKLKTLPLDPDGQEQLIPVQEGDDVQYSIGEDKTHRGGQDSSNLSLLVPEENKESLKVSGHGNSLKFDKVFSVRKTAQIPKIDYEKLTVPRSNVIKVEGLRTRHYASGYGAEEGDDVESKGDDAKDISEDTSKDPSERKSKKHKKHQPDEGHSKKKSKKDKKK